MAKLSKDEFTTTLKTLVGDRDDDDTLKALEDLTDTYDAFTSDANEDWKTKYEENDKAWRDKYKERFLQGSESDDPKTADEDDSNKDADSITYDDLFEDD